MSNQFMGSHGITVKARKDSDKIEVIIRDESWTPYFKGSANLKSKKEMKQLLEDLKDKGVDLGITKWL